MSLCEKLSLHEELSCHCVKELSCHCVKSCHVTV